MNHVIIGNSAAGISVAETIRENEEDAEITVLSEEPYNPYSRIFLPKFISGEATLDSLSLRSADFWDALRVHSLLGAKVLHVSVKECEIELMDGKRIGFDNLFICSGASSLFPKIPGLDSELEGITGLRTIDDGKRILQRLEKTRSIVILGGGLVGIKAAEALGSMSKDLRITVVESAENILPERLDIKASRIIQRRMELYHIDVLLSNTVTEIIGREEVEGVRTDSGELLECGLVIIAAGVTPNVEFLSNTGVKVNRGVVVDQEQRTNFSNIFAAGDVAEAFDPVQGEFALNPMWLNAVTQGTVAGLNAIGVHRDYEGSLALNSGAFFGISVAAIGVTNPKDSLYQEEVLFPGRDIYRKVVLDQGRLVGALLIGDVSGMGVFHSLIRQRRELGESFGSLGRRKLSYAHILDLIRRGNYFCAS
jgi:NAD(P)H-nitrite reductase large subunit